MKQKLSDREEEIMQLLWDNGPLFVREMLEKLPGAPRHFNTVSTFVRLMEQKGFVGHEQLGNSHRYHALISREEYSRTELKSVMSRYFNNSLRSVVSALVAEESLTDDQINELVEKVKRGKEEKCQ
ncbi:MAG: BlaI/MecI/CopY family transcriptional regulator [Muribaculaceae bacterium]|nr:BlaI/MecI/CopY family transcriptional regulator [Muribaculaceae bacterium]